MDDWTIKRIGDKPIQDDDSVKFIMHECWVLVPIHMTPLNRTNFHNIPMSIIRSVPFTRQVSTYREGMKIRAKKFTWDDYNRLNDKFKQQCNWDGRWSFHWRGPNTQCWCHKKLYSPYQECKVCKEDLTHWVILQQHKPYRAEFKTPSDWAEEVEQELF